MSIITVGSWGAMNGGSKMRHEVTVRKLEKLGSAIGTDYSYHTHVIEDDDLPDDLKARLVCVDPENVFIEVNNEEHDETLCDVCEQINGILNMEFRVIRIFWKNDSSELMDLPEAKVLTCGSDGMEVLGVESEIDKLREYVEKNPNNFEMDDPEAASCADFQGAVKFASKTVGLEWIDSVSKVLDYVC